jgi:hypothetical protein
MPAVKILPVKKVNGFVLLGLTGKTERYEHCSCDIGSHGLSFIGV